MSEDESSGSDSEPQRRRKRKVKLVRNEDRPCSSNSSGLMESTSIGRKTHRRIFTQNDSDSDSGSSIDPQPKRKCVPRVPSDGDSDSSDSVVVVNRTKRSVRFESDSDSDHGFEGSSTSQWESDLSDSGVPQEKNRTVQDTGDAIDSDSSDGQSEKCPICLLSLKTQEIGTPESCDHMFCVECIQEWSKNMNTCPVDRHEYRLILVRRNMNGHVYRKIPIEPPNPLNEGEITEDPTFCEICGSSEREDRMLLCDGCDMGFHLECLAPPLADVPIGAWFCSDCSPTSAEDVISREIEMYEVQLLLDDAEEIGRPRRLRRMTFPTPRLIPRTRQSERVRSRIETNRQSNRDQPETSVTSTSNLQIRRKKRRKPRRRYRTVYEIDATTGETIAVKKLIRKRYKSRRKKRNRICRVNSVKKRLAVQLGMCRPPAGVPQATPDVKVLGSDTISSQRYKAAIPTLHLFGQRDELDLFSPSDNEDGDDVDGGSILMRRRPNHSDVAAMRRRIGTKSITLPMNSVSSTSDLLGDILNAQESFHSRSTELSLGVDGRFTIKPTKNAQKLNNCNESVTKCHGSSSSSPGSDSVPTSSGNANNYQPASRSPENASTAPTSTVEGNLNLPSASSVGGGDRYQGGGDQLGGGSDFKVETRSPTPGTDSEIDIYSDIETVSTSKADENECGQNSPPLTSTITTNTASDDDHDDNDDGDDDNDSEQDMVIDTDKALPESEENTKEEAAVTSTVDVGGGGTEAAVTSSVHSTLEIQSQAVQSSNEFVSTPTPPREDDSEDECPNFSIYSKESITMAQNTDVTLNPSDQVGEVSSSPAVADEADVLRHSPEEVVVKKSSGGLYSDSEDETIVKKKTSFALGDIRNMTEDISEDERSYTPCLDERGPGLEGLDTEMISDEDRNDFDESHDLKTASDGDALEINVKESEMDLTRPEDYEEGEIVDKSKVNEIKEEVKIEVEAEECQEPDRTAPAVTIVTKRENVKENDNENDEKAKETSFKKLSKSTKERNYRDKDKEKERSRSRDRRKSHSKERRKEKRKEIERYDVRAVIAVKPRRLKDKFGRDIIRPSESNSRSPSPDAVEPTVASNNKSPRRKSRSLSKSRKKRRRTNSRTKSPERKRSRSRGKKRKRSKSRERRRKSRERSSTRNKKAKSRSRSPPASAPNKRRTKEWTARRQSRDWSPSLSRSRSPEPRHFTPSWTPPRMIDSSTVQPRNLTVILTNDSTKTKKAKDRKKKAEKKTKENDRQKKRKRTDPTPPPSKEVFASGDNILVSVSFNKDNDTRDVSTKRKPREKEDTVPPKKKKEKRGKVTVPAPKKASRDLTGVKPVAIIDLERSPFKELTPSPKDVIVLSDSDTEESRQKACDSSQQVGSPERTGPKTPPEPQIKFTLTSKPPQLRAISNPLHEPDDVEAEGDTQEVDDVHIGPNTPPEPSESPPSSPDAYDPFEPTKSRSPTPENPQNQSVSTIGTTKEDKQENSIENLGGSEGVAEKSSVGQTPETLKSHTPPLADVQPADSQSSTHASPESNVGKSPAERATPQSQSSGFSGSLVQQIVPFSSVATSIISTTPVSSNLAQTRINILNSSLSTSSINAPRIVLPTIICKSISPSKSMPTSSKSSRKSGNNNRSQNGAESSGENLILDSPYSPGSSDYEDLFEPPAESPAKSNPVAKPVAKKSPTKIQTAFDVLFGSPFNKNNKNPDSKSGNKFVKKTTQPTTIGGGSKGKGNKQVGVKVDEDSLKILDELPNSAVEMQVKDKFLKKLNRQERVVEEVKLVLKPHYNKKHINKDEYKDILRRAVPKICHNKSGEINPTKIKNLIEAYVKKIRHSKKVTSSSSVNSQKV